MQVIDDPELDWQAAAMPTLHGGHTPASVKAAVLGLQSIATRLRAARFARGALRLDKVKVGFVINQGTGMPEGVCDYALHDSNRLVEEFMLMANMSVAKRLHEAFPKHALLRNHPPPKEVPLKKVAALCLAKGIALDISSAGGIQTSLDAVAGDSNAFYR
jgi:DIS3-like exonuclease 2